MNSGTRLFIGNLAYATTSDKLRAVAEHHGPVRACLVVVDRTTGASRGYGFIEYLSAADAVCAQEALAGARLDGRRLNCEFAHPKPAPASRPRQPDPAREAVMPPAATTPAPSATSYHDDWPPPVARRAWECPTCGTRLLTTEAPARCRKCGTTEAP
jgi:RNA recognition motif-containing protein